MTERYAQVLYPLGGTPCVVCGLPADAVVRTVRGPATAHTIRETGSARLCPHPPTGDTPHGRH